MTRIAQLGEEIGENQRHLGLSNPDNLNPGLSQKEIFECPLFQNIPPDSELHDLYAWRNGGKNGVAMGKLWIVPGHYFVTAQDSVLWNLYSTKNIPDWKSSWFPIMSSGSSDVHFIDKERCSDGKFPVFYHDPEFLPGRWQIYDSLESMFRSVLECYAQAAYFVRDGDLHNNARRKAAICARFNPASDHWRRKDLF